MMAKSKLMIVLLLLCSCTSHHNPYRIDLTEIADCRTTATSDELFSSILYIPLETTSDCLIGSGSLFAVDENNILVWASGDRILRFDRNGKFLHSIGRTGNGYGEHGMLNSVNYDKQEKVVYLGTPGNVIYKYAIDGTYIGNVKIPVSEGLLQTVRFNEQLGLVCEVRHYTSDGIKVDLMVVSKEGDLISSDMVYADERQVEVTFMRTGMLRNCTEGTLFMLPYDDRLFFLDSAGVSDSLELFRGNFSPDRELVEDARRLNELYAKKYSINNMVVTHKNLYLLIEGENRQYDVLVDRGTNKVAYTWSYQYSDEKGNIPLKDFDNVTFWPWITTLDGEVADLVSIERFDEADLKKLQEISMNHFPLNEDSNPVVIIAKEK